MRMDFPADGPCLTKTSTKEPQDPDAHNCGTLSFAEEEEEGDEKEEAEDEE